MIEKPRDQCTITKVIIKLAVPCVSPEIRHLVISVLPFTKYAQPPQRKNAKNADKTL